MRILTLFAAFTLLSGGLMCAQEKKDQKGADKASSSRGKGDAKDPNIKGGTDVNKSNANIPAPPDKGGAARAGVCQIHVDNRTTLYIKIYVDGDYKGVVGPWGDGVTYAYSGSTRLYARADFDDGTYSSFGPRVISCYGTYTWALTP